MNCLASLKKARQSDSGRKSLQVAHFRVHKECFPLGKLDDADLQLFAA